MQAIFAGFPGQVEWIDRDTVPTQSGSRIVGRKAKRLGRCCIHYLEDIDSHTVGDDFHFIDQADIHCTVNILKQLGHLSSLGGADRYNLINGLLV
ncbi:hypothetical protein D3C84_631350 [compost metagenome]